MKLFDRFCVAILFVLSIVNGLLVPKTYTGRIWIFGTMLALLFTSLLNVLRIRNGRDVRGLRLSCITANVTMLVLAIALIASIGKTRTLQHPQVPIVAALLLAGLISINQSSDGVTLSVKVHPRARKNAITGELDGAVKISLTGPATDGKANDACIDFFAKLLKVSRSSVTIASGLSSRMKLIRVAGLSAEEVRKRIAILQEQS